jgi:hypothetical protein
MSSPPNPHVEFLNSLLRCVLKNKGDECNNGNAEGEGEGVGAANDGNYFIEKQKSNSILGLLQKAKNLQGKRSSMFFENWSCVIDELNVFEEMTNGDPLSNKPVGELTEKSVEVLRDVDVNMKQLRALNDVALISELGVAVLRRHRVASRALRSSEFALKVFKKAMLAKIRETIKRNVIFGGNK